jgi:sugar lactone lactonase YvrE
MKKASTGSLVALASGLLLLGCGANKHWNGPPADGFADGPAADGDAESSGVCIDSDGDGHGPTCAAGLDCDDSDPAHFDDCAHCFTTSSEGCICSFNAPFVCYEGPGGTADIGICRKGLRSCLETYWGPCEGQVLPNPVELCNGLDDDCDGEVDEGALGECGDCDPRCHIESIGKDGDAPWSPTEDNSESVVVNEDGGLELDRASVNTNLIWVANTGEGSVSKIDIRTFEQLGRYATGYDPSRTSVDPRGDVYVGNRNGQSVTKVSALGDRCPDTNGDGVVTTSHGADLLPWGQDDCVLWRTDLSGYGLVRAVAAQEVYTLDGARKQVVWIGSWDAQVIWKLDGDTGEILVGPTPAPSQTYGFAIDGHGNLWMMGGQLGRVDTTRCVDNASCNVTVCGADGDDCIKQAIPMPAGGYGITVDFRQRVWIGGAVMRYDPAAPSGARWTTVSPAGFVHGIAADAEGWVWGAAMGEVYRFSADDPTVYTTVGGASGYSAKGAAVDSEGKIWMINQSHNNATVITPGPGLTDATVQAGVAPYFSTPYTYSDMTGNQLRFAMNPRGFYDAVFEGCEEGGTEWHNLTFELTAPTSTTVVIRARTADEAAALEAAPWVTVATVPDAVSPASVLDAFARESVTHGKFLEVDIALASEIVDTAEPVSPVVYRLSISHFCPEAPVF